MLGYLSFLVFAIACAALYFAICKVQLHFLRLSLNKELKKDEIILNSLKIEQAKNKMESAGELNLFPHYQGLFISKLCDP